MGRGEIRLVDQNVPLWRGPRPNDLEELRRLGIERIISLQSGIYELFADDRYERQFPSDFGMEHYHLASSDFTPPEPWVVAKFLELVTKDPKPTFLHCLSGVDRTGFLSAVYRMRVQGWSYEDAKAEWIAVGRHVWYYWWESSLKKWNPNR